MKTQKIKVQIEAEVPMGNNCSECIYQRPLTLGAYCGLFNKGLYTKPKSKDSNFIKCQACLDACANGTERALKELAGEGE